MPTGTGAPEKNLEQLGGGQYRPSVRPSVTHSTAFGASEVCSRPLGMDPALAFAPADEVMQDSGKNQTISLHVSRLVSRLVRKVRLAFAARAREGRLIEGFWVRYAF